jgi:hypothetical protein
VPGRDGRPELSEKWALDALPAQIYSWFTKGFDAAH